MLVSAKELTILPNTSLWRPSHSAKKAYNDFVNVRKYP